MKPAPVETLQHPRELERLLDLYRAVEPRRVLEIGTFAGGTLYHWLTNAHPDTVIVSVDGYWHRDNRHLYPAWTPPGVELIVIQGDSSDETTISQARRYAPYDFTYIDAGHYLHQVTADWDNYAPMTRPGGLVVLHDITPTSDPTIEVDQLWDHLERQYDTRTIAEPGGFGFGIVHIPAGFPANYPASAAGSTVRDRQ